MKKKLSPPDLGIDLSAGNNSELFKWFFACLLFGKPIQQEVAARTYRVFEQAGMISVRELSTASWETLVRLLDEGHYVRFDFSTATKLQGVVKQLAERYGGRVSNLVEGARNLRMLNRSLEEFTGIGPVTARIFARGLKESGHYRGLFSTKGRPKSAGDRQPGSQPHKSVI